jgi:hypothetical protein
MRNLEFRKKKFKTREESDTVYLNIKELEQFEKLQLDATLDYKVRDLFLIVLYWFKISDFTTNTTRKYKQQCFYIRTQKTSERA